MLTGGDIIRLLRHQAKSKAVLKAEPKAEPKREDVLDPGFRPARGQRYLEFFRHLHEHLLFDWYLEIGCQKGASLSPVRSKTIAVDPFFRAEINIIGTKPALHVFQATSDDFFASGFLARNGIRLSLSFLDGMHFYEFLLRDFMNAEAYSDPGGVIMLHDCVPYSFAMTTRDLGMVGPGVAWTGDVWKLIPILQKWRPDLRLEMLDCLPTAVVCVTNLAPESRVLRENHAAILTEWDGVELEAYGLDRFLSSFSMVSAADCAQGGFQMFRPASIDPTLALKPELHST